MGTTKTEIYSEQSNRIASIFKVLGHPGRIAILEYLIKSKSCVCGEIVDEIGLAQATISQHLKELKKVGIIQGTVSGTATCYCINPERWKELEEVVSQFFALGNFKAECC